MVVQVRTRVVRSLHPHTPLSLGTDAFLLDCVPPSPYHATDPVLHTRSRSSPHYWAADRDAAVRSPPPGVHRAAPDDQAGPCSRRPTTPQSPPPPPPAALVYYNGLSNAAFAHSDPAPAAGAPGRGHTPSSPSHNGFGRSSPVIPRRRDADGRRSAAGDRPDDDRYVHGHPRPPPPAAPGPGLPSSAADAPASAPANHPSVALGGPLSLSTGVLNFSPPAPHLTPNHRVRVFLSHTWSYRERFKCAENYIK